MPVQTGSLVPAVGAARLLFSAAFFSIAWTAYVAYKAETFSDAAFAVILMAFGILPTLIWIVRWRDTLPMMPLYGLVNVLHFGLPFTSQTSDVLNYSEPEKWAGTLTVCAMLMAATAAWVAVMGFVRIRPQASKRLDTAPIERILPYGFGAAVLFNWMEFSGAAYQLGNLYPVARAIFGSIFFVSAYLFGALWADRALGLRTRLLCLLLFGLAAIITWSSLYLYPSMFVTAMFFIGYMISARRVPVGLVVAVLAVFFVLQSGKSNMRERYQYDAPVGSIQEFPGFVTEWATEGVAGLVTPAELGTVHLDDRIGLMHMLLRAQSMTPDQVDYLGGETYALIPRLLVPRFIDPEKPVAHAGLIMLNVRYGLLVGEEIDQTSIGWGMLPEAYANFGNLGAVGLGLVMGALFAAITLWSSGAPALSGPAMFGVMVMIASFNLEADTALFSTTVLQGGIAILAITLLLGLLGRDSNSGARRAY
jgi:hypothetical protein